MIQKITTRRYIYLNFTLKTKLSLLVYFLFNFGNYVRTAETKKVSNTICHKNASVGCCGSLEFSVGATLQKNCGQTYATMFESHFKKSPFQFLRQKLKLKSFSKSKQTAEN